MPERRSCAPDATPITRQAESRPRPAIARTRHPRDLAGRRSGRPQPGMSSLDAPDMAAPRERLTIPVSLANLPAGERRLCDGGRAVDVGILNLTNYCRRRTREAWYFSASAALASKSAISMAA